MVGYHVIVDEELVTRILYSPYKEFPYQRFAGLCVCNLEAPNNPPN